MKRTIFLVSTIAIFGCSNQSNHQSFIDSLKKSQEVDSIVKNETVKAELNKVKLSSTTCPLKITKCYVTIDRFGQQDINIDVKNVSGKTIDGIKFRWVLFNNFGDQVPDLETGVSQKILKNNKTDYYIWDIYASTATKGQAYVNTIHYTDGSKWELPKK